MSDQNIIGSPSNSYIFLQQPIMLQNNFMKCRIIFDGPIFTGDPEWVFRSEDEIERIVLNVFNDRNQAITPDFYRYDPRQGF